MKKFKRKVKRKVKRKGMVPVKMVTLNAASLELLAREFDIGVVEAILMDAKNRPSLGSLRDPAGYAAWMAQGEQMVADWRAKKENK